MEILDKLAEKLELLKMFSQWCHVDWLKYGNELLQEAKEILNDVDLDTNFQKVDNKIQITIVAETSDQIKLDKITRLKILVKKMEEKHPQFFKHLIIVLKTKNQRLLLTG